MPMTAEQAGRAVERLNQACVLQRPSARRVWALADGFEGPLSDLEYNRGGLLYRNAIRPAISGDAGSGHDGAAAMVSTRTASRLPSINEAW
jgi:hypothetical protein